MYSGNQECEYCGYVGMSYTEEGEGREESCDMCGYHSYEVADDYEEDEYENMFTEPTTKAIEIAKKLIEFEESNYGREFRDLFLDEFYWDYSDYLNTIKEEIDKGYSTLFILFCMLFSEKMT